MSAAIPMTAEEGRVAHPPEAAGDPEDRTRIQRVRDGDLEAFEELYRAHCGRVYAVCLRMSGNVARAEELTQEVFVRAWQKLSSFRGESRFSSWLVRVAINLVLSDRRSRSRREEHQGGEGLEETAESFSAASPASDLDRVAAVDLERAIASLPPGARTVFVLHDVEGYRHREIALLTSSAVGTCKAQLHRARKLLRKALQP